MTDAREQQRARTGWIVSAFIHAGLLFLSATLLVRPAQFHVTPGRTSTEIDFLMQAAPTLPQVVTQIPPVLVPPPQILPAVKPDDLVIPLPRPLLLPAPAPIPSARANAKTHVAKSAFQAFATRRSEASNPSRSVVQAQPDDLHNEPPEYPEGSREAGEQGVVILRVQVTAEGLPASIHTLRSSGFFDLDQAARRAVEHWKFHPGSIAGIPSPSEVDVPVRFKLQ